MASDPVAATGTALPSAPEGQESPLGFSSGSGSSNKHSPSLGRGYEVFLSFRGADTRKKFTDSLYHSLKDAGIDVFRDNEELHVGEEIGPELLDRIERSKISIPIFSENYASSKWCLRELACMMECRKQRKQLVLPVFYDVTPDQVQHQEGSFKRAFAKHVEDSKHDQRVTVQKWRKALEEIGRLKGWDLQNDTNGHEGQLIKLIVHKVLGDLKKGHLVVTKNFVSVDVQKTAVIRLLAIGIEDVRIIGICGMGGIGKTTLAKVIYNQIMGNFDSCSFLKNIRETSSHRNGLKHLQSRLIADLSRCEYREIASTDDGTNDLEERFLEKKVLIVLDDVDHSNQLKGMISVDWFAPGSRIIITTRNKNALSLVPEELTYNVEVMGQALSMELFCKHAFRCDNPPPEFSSLSKDIVKTTGGLPLALEVIGSLLCGKKIAIWVETLDKLKEKPLMEVQEKLRISYESLEPEQQSIFLDIACFFIGEHVNSALPMWKGCKFYPEGNLDELVMRCLIKIADDDKLWMHDQLRDLGREIVRQQDEIEPGKRSRLWHNEDATSVVKECEGSPIVEAIRLEFPFRLEESHLTSKSFKDMSNLRFLQMDGADLDGDFQNLLPKLRYIRMRKSLFEYKPSNLDLRNLVVLDLSDSSVTHDWAGWTSMQIGSKLKVLKLSRCKRLTRMPELMMLKELEVLYVGGCTKIEKLPNLSNLKLLRELDAAGCWELQGLEGLDGLTALELLYIRDCREIVNLPSLSSLKALRRLDARRCRKLQGLEGLDESVNLEDLLIGSCTQIEKLPSLSNLKRLRTLEVDNCIKLRGLDGLNGLAALEVLQIAYCQEIDNLPSLSNLTVLRHLDATGCRNLKGIDGLDGLIKLDVLWIDELQKVDMLPNLSNLKALRALYASRCEKLKVLEGLDGLEALEFLYIRDCNGIVKLPDLSNMKILRHLDTMGSRKLQELTGLDRLVTLKVLWIGPCEEMRKLPNLSNLKALITLNVSGCKKLQQLEGLDGLVSLEELHIEECENIEKLPDLSNLKSLRKLSVSSCRRLQGLEGLDGLVDLVDLLIGGCSQIEQLPDLSNLKALRTLDASGCKKLQGLKGLDGLVSLQIFSISGCEVIKELPNLWNLQKLNKMDVSGCRKQQFLAGIDPYRVKAGGVLGILRSSDN